MKHKLVSEEPLIFVNTYRCSWLSKITKWIAFATFHFKHLRDRKTNQLVPLKEVNLWGRPSSPRTRPVPDAQAKACGFWLTHKLTNSSLLCKQSIAWPLIGRSYFDVQKHTNKVCRRRGMSPGAAAGVLVEKRWQNNKHSVLVNNIDKS